MESMTGFGQAEGKVGKGKLYVELKTINHRYGEMNFRIPPRMGSLEGRIRDFLKVKIQRGKCDLYIREVEPVFGEAVLNLDLELAQKYQKAVEVLRKKLKSPQTTDILALAGVDRFIRAYEPDGDYSRLWRDVEKLLQKAWQQIEKMRRTEGTFLLKDQKKRLQLLDSALGKIEKISHRNLRQKQEEAVPDIMMNNQNPVSFNNKMDISEEVTRLRSHVEQYRDMLSSHEPIGRKIDFLIQEMHREVNTIGAKGQDAEIARFVVEVKAELEKLREQIQNVE